MDGFSYEIADECRVSHWFVDLILIWMFHHLDRLPSSFSQIPTSPSIIGQTVEQSKSKSTQPGDGSPCSLELKHRTKTAAYLKMLVGAV